jgi:uncharacterized tellurite resistance protein B-like protein
MAFWDIFKQNETEHSKFTQLHKHVTEILPEQSDEDHILVACLAGLVARVAQADFEIEDREIESMESSIHHWLKLDKKMVQAIIELAIKEVVTLSGLENHKYCYPLNDILDNDQKFGILETLFQVAASDENVSETEAEEIRLICKALNLEHRHFIAARATVLEYLGILKK